MTWPAFLTALCLLIAPSAEADPVRIDAARSQIADSGWTGAQIDLQFSSGVPYRLFTLDDPARLVLDFQEIDWSGLDAEALLRTSRISDVRFGAYGPGNARMVLDLAQPMAVQEAAMTMDKVGGAAHLSIDLVAEDAETFAASAGTPYDARWDLPAPAEVPEPAPHRSDAPMVVVLDPGHGGIDPGAETEAVAEKDLTLVFARELRDVLLSAGGFEVILTRNGDYFVSLERRIALAHAAGADVFLSLHADSLLEGHAKGTTVHVLAHSASDEASAKLAERHDRAEVLSGVDLRLADDEVTEVLLDLARQETQPRSEALASALITGLAEAGIALNRKPLRRAAFSVLKAADIPSVLIEIGFLSNPNDLQNLTDPHWRATAARGIRDALQAWRRSDAASRPLVRK